MKHRIVVLGMGYAAQAFAHEAIAIGWSVVGTKRAPNAQTDETPCVDFSKAHHNLLDATHVLISTPPGPDGDPAFTLYAATLRASPALQWIGYYSTTGIYGDHGGGRVDEATPPAPSQHRHVARLKAETAWHELAFERGIHCDIMRLGGIYGPGRSAFDALRTEFPRVIDAPDYRFSRIHRDDIAGATRAAIDTAQGLRILNFTDSEPSPQRDVFNEAARLLDMPAPTAVSLESAWPDMSPMARSFWTDRRIVDSAKTQALLRRQWRYPSYREGLAAILHQTS